MTPSPPELGTGARGSGSAATESHTQLLDLPDALLVMVMGILATNSDVLNVAWSCRQLMTLLPKMKHWKSAGPVSKICERFQALESLIVTPPPSDPPPPMEMLLAAPTPLKYLKSLSLHGWNLLREVPPCITAATLLESLDLSFTAILHVKELVKLKNLRWLNLSHSPIREIAPLAQAPSLMTLDISVTRVNDISCLRASTSLKTIRACLLLLQLTAPICFPQQVRHLELCHSDAVDSIEGVRFTPRLVHLNLHFSRVSHIAILSKCPRLVFLDLANTHINSIDVLLYLPNLEYLDISGTRLTQIDALRACTKLKRLNIRHVPISDIRSIRPLSNSLVNLDMDHTRISDLSPLANFKKLEQIEARFCPLTDILPLASCLELKFLDVSHTDVTNIDALVACKNLKYLDASFTNVNEPPVVIEQLISIQKLKFVCRAEEAIGLSLHDDRIFSDDDEPQPEDEPEPGAECNRVVPRIRWYSSASQAAKTIWTRIANTLSSCSSP